MNERSIKKACSISEHEGMTKGLKTKDRNETTYFDSHWSAGVDCNCENQDSSREVDEEQEWYSDHELESDSEIEIEESHIDEEDDEYLPPGLQEVSDDFKSDSSDEKTNAKLDNLPELQVKTRRKTTDKESESDSHSNDDKDIE